MFVLVIRTMASVGSLMIGSGTESTLTLRFACHVTAFMWTLSVLSSIDPFEKLADLSLTRMRSLGLARFTVTVQRGERLPHRNVVRRAGVERVCVPVGPATR